MKKLYKYRPLNDLLYKEIFYQEIYFASYAEINDPIDLSAKIDFFPNEEQDIEYLIYFFCKSFFKHSLLHNSSRIDKETFIFYTSLKENTPFVTQLKTLLYTFLKEAKSEEGFISATKLEIVFNRAIKEINVELNISFHCFIAELERLSKVFIENSYISSFSDTNNNFLMWSHYSSNHSGICLEFSLENPRLFPYQKEATKNLSTNNFKLIYDGTSGSDIFYGNIYKVTYTQHRRSVNFFEFAPVFENEGDCDLMKLSKTRWHCFALELNSIFSTKKLAWSYEKEWRAISIKFGDPQFPEERISHYPIEALSAIYFGIKTPDHVKKRIVRIFQEKQVEMKFFDCKLLEDTNLTFPEYEDLV